MGGGKGREKKRQGVGDMAPSLFITRMPEFTCLFPHYKGSSGEGFRLKRGAFVGILPTLLSPWQDLCFFIFCLIVSETWQDAGETLLLLICFYSYAAVVAFVVVVVVATAVVIFMMLMVML